MLWLLLLLGINAYGAWRYSDLDIDPDFALFNMAGQLDAWYGRDIVDCKSPLVHIWFWLLAKVDKDIRMVRAIHYTITGIPGLIYYCATGDVIPALAYIVLIHSGHLFTFHGNVGDIPAGLIFLALMTMEMPWIASALFILAILYEPKLIVAYIPWAIAGGFLWQSVTFLLLGACIGYGIWYWHNDWWEWLVEANITIPSRMNKNRTGRYPWMPQYTSAALLYVGMWSIPIIINTPNLIYWLPPLIYLLFMFAGKVVRPNHLIPLVSWLAFATSGLEPTTIIGLTLVDYVSSGFYLGDIWARFYPGIRSIIFETRKLGEWLKDKPGKLWLNSMYSEIYIWSGKKPLYGMTEQVEINEVAKERRDKMRVRLANNPPDWVIDQPGYVNAFDPSGYKKVGQSNNFIVYKRNF